MRAVRTFLYVSHLVRLAVQSYGDATTSIISICNSISLFPHLFCNLLSALFLHLHLFYNQYSISIFHSRKWTFTHIWLLPKITLNSNTQTRTHNHTHLYSHSLYESNWKAIPKPIKQCDIVQLQFANGIEIYTSTNTLSNPYWVAGWLKRQKRATIENENT